ncbi:hypothetical protein GJAV_G00017990 [Gymnothorax javanicus]|nr:hypothetical protein GJAV_G00017990 [Gymnothorax javanicus]
MLHSAPYLLLLCSIIGCHAAKWSMSVPAQVNGTKGQNATLPCTFTHPSQQFFTGEILVKWITGGFYGHNIFQCSVMNRTEGRYDQCSDPEAPNRYSLLGSPQDRNLSLLIQGLKLSDINRYYCRVELSRKKLTSYQSEGGTRLQIFALPEILNFSLVPGPSPSNVSLECVAEGSPRPTLTYYSPAGQAISDMMSNSLEVNSFRTLIRIPITSRDTYVCRAKNQLGSVEQVFHLHHTPPTLSLVLWISGALLILGLGLAVLWLKQRGNTSSCSFGCRKKHKEETHSQPPEAPPGSEIPVYVNSSEVRGDTGIVYADIKVKKITNSLEQRNTMKDLDKDVCYAEVAFN